MATVFVIAVLVPTLVLAWLAMRSLRDQEIVANSQRAILHQSSTEALAADLNIFMDAVRVFYRQLILDLVEENGAAELSLRFDEIAPSSWPQCSVACVVTDGGEILCPSPSTTDPAARKFLKFNAQFLLNQSDVQIYEAAPVNNVGPIVTTNRVDLPKSASSPAAASRAIANSVSPRSDSRVSKLKKTAVAAPSLKPVDKSEQAWQYNVEVAEEKIRSYNPFRRMSQSEQRAEPKLETAADGFADMELNSKLNTLKEAQPSLRKVQPSQSVFGTKGIVQQSDASDNISKSEWGIGNLQDIVEGKTEGALSRFFHDGLHVMLWSRHPDVEDRIFWVELDLDEIKAHLDRIVSGYSFNADICLALLDADGNIVSKTDEDFSTDWAKPFVASEVGQILPFWEVGAYLINPDTVNQSVKTAKLTIWLLVPTLLAAIGIGTLLIFRSIGLEMQMARQKTDFVSNVSHELKTPLTSIRMFSDMLTAEATSEKDRQYSGIISREAARLSRLINNLLDFSRLERTDNPYSMSPLDLAEVTTETIETYKMQLEADGCHLVYTDKPDEEVMVSGDRDALSQVLLNLLSNAEKYGCAKGEIEVRLLVDAEQQMAEWQVLDRGEGIDRKHSARIFEKFYRVDDSLANGIQGSGLGLALAKQIISHHEGMISFKNRAEGGSCFSVNLPITP